MSFESKISKVQIISKPITEKTRPFDSPENRKSLDRKDSPSKSQEPSSPRYRSPIHSRIPHTAENCPTCEKRLQEPPLVKFHESPPKVRPSHHHVVCEDCSEGSFSHVLKVICLNEAQDHELATGTQKVKIIESAPSIPTSSSFPIIGEGQTVQVLYQEVYPPPKPELTSLLPESYRENGILKYTLKEEERKRVAIRRAEYANRIKGVSKTIVTTVSPHSERLSRKERKMSIDIKARDTSYDEDIDRLVTSERKSAKDLVKSEKDERGLNGKIDENFEIKVDKKVTNKNEKNMKVEKNCKNELLKNDGLWKTSYFGSIRDRAAGEKGSVKHRILAKLAGKDFSGLFRDEQQDDNDDQKDPVQDPDLEELKEPETIQNEIPKKSQNLQEKLESTLKPIDFIQNSPEISLKAHEDHLKSPENDQIINPSTSGPCGLDLVDEDFPNTKTLSDPSEINQKTSELNQKTPELNQKTSEQSPKIPDLSNIDLTNTFKTPYFPETTFGKTLKSGENSSRSPKDISKDDPIHEVPQDLIKTSKYSSPIITESNPDIQSPTFKDFISPSFADPTREGVLIEGDPSIKASPKESQDDKSEKSEKSEKNDKNDSPSFKSDLESDPSSFSLHLHPGFEVKQTPPSSSRESPRDIESSPKVLEIFEETEVNLKSETKQSRQSLNSNQSLHSTLANPLQETIDTPGKSTQEASLDKTSVERINHLFFILADPQVIKGLKLLGGFADYLEKNGKDVLDWKL